MPNNTAALKTAVEEAFARDPLDACIFTGEAIGRTKVTFERIATNLRDFRVPDRAGNLVQQQLTEEDGPVAYWSTLQDADAMIGRLAAHGIPAAVSNHAGNNLCNQIFYLGLHWAATHGSRMQIGFVHLPALPEQNLDRCSDVPSMPLEMSRAALGLIARALCDTLSK